MAVPPIYECQVTVHFSDGTSKLWGTTTIRSSHRTTADFIRNTNEWGIGFTESNGDEIHYMPHMISHIEFKKLS
jgi:hypothetical protein